MIIVGSLAGSTGYYSGSIVAGQYITPTIDISVSGIGFFVLDNNCSGLPWIEMRSGIQPYPIIGSWQLSSTPSLDYGWTDVYNINHAFKSGNSYIILLKSPYSFYDWDLDEGSYISTNEVQSNFSGLGFGDINESYHINFYENTRIFGGSVGILPEYDTMFRIYGTTVQSQAFSQLLSETITFTQQEYQAFSQILSESFTLGDGTQKGGSFWKADTTQILDYITKNPNLFKVDTLALADSIRKADTATKTENLTIGEYFSRIASYFRIPVEALSVVDNITKTISIYRCDRIAP